MLSGLHQIRKLKIFGAILALSFAFISAHPVFAEVDIELSIDPTLQVVIPTSTVSLTLTPNPDPSIPVFASENLVVSVATNNPTGYSLMLKADSTNLTNTVADREGNYSILPTLVDQVGGYAEESFTTNTWGYRNTNTLLNNTVTNNTTGNYNAFTTSSEILSSKLPTNLDQTSLDFAAKVDITQPAGTYELALNFEAVTNVIPGVVTINYEPNGADNPDAMTKQQFEVVSPENLTPNSYTKANYVFIGWNTAKDGSGTSYNNNQLYVPPEGTQETSNIDLTLYAQWALAMQAVTTAQCTETPTKVADSRDGTVYTIQRLNDGKCWMMENLRLDGGRTLTPADTNVAVNFNLPANITSGTATYTTAETIAVDGEDTYGSKYGNLYNYCAASAGTICASSNSANATYDICPKGWRLPTGGASGEFGQLMVAYGGLTTNMTTSTTPTGATMSTTLQQTLKFPLAGNFTNAAPVNQGSNGAYWSSTYNTSTNMYNMYNLYFNASNVSPQNYTTRNYGRSVRCVMNKYMQDVTAADVAAMAEGETTIMVDKRDNNAYTVAKINGNLWMTQNLRIAGGETLTSSDSNVSANYTIPTTDLTSGDTYTEGRIHNSGNTTNGYWYNFCAASAGTICTDSNSTNATYDICPKGWRLPTNSEQSGITSYATEFSPVTGGYYISGSLYNTGYGYWWSSTAYNTANRYLLGYRGSSLSTNYSIRYVGYYVRCIRSS